MDHGTNHESRAIRVSATAEPQQPAIHLTGDEALALHRASADWQSASQALRYLADLARAHGDDDRAARFIETAHAL